MIPNINHDCRQLLLVITLVAAFLLPSAKPCRSQIETKQTIDLTSTPTATTKSGYTLTIPAMGVRFRVVLYCDSPEQAKSAFALAEKKLFELENIFTDYDDQSEALRLSRLPPDARFPVSHHMLLLLTQSNSIRQQTNGCFDVTVGKLTQIWRKQKRAPSTEAENSLRQQYDQQVEAIMNRTNPCFVLDPHKLTFQQGENPYSLDFGGIAKGYSADVLLQTLKEEMGIDQVLIDASGDITVGTAPPGNAEKTTGWLVGLSQLNPDQGLQQKLRLENYSVASSGDARQFFEDDRGRFSHILDPRSGKPIKGQHLTVVANPKGDIADALASALSVCNEEEFLIIVNRFPGTHALRMLKTEKGIKTQASHGWQQWIQLHQDGN